MKLTETKKYIKIYGKMAMLIYNVGVKQKVEGFNPLSIEQINDFKPLRKYAKQLAMELSK